MLTPVAIFSQFSIHIGPFKKPTCPKEASRSRSRLILDRKGLQGLPQAMCKAPQGSWLLIIAKTPINQPLRGYLDFHFSPIMSV